MNAYSFNAFEKVAAGMTATTGIPSTNQQTREPSETAKVQVQAETMSDHTIFSSAFAHISPNVQRVTYSENLFKSSP